MSKTPPGPSSPVPTPTVIGNTPDTNTIPANNPAPPEKNNMDSPKSPDSLNPLFTFLHDTKEILAIIVFFVGGILWIYTAFATKGYVETIRCLLGATIQRIDFEAQSRALKDEITDLKIQVKQLQSLSNSDILAIERMNSNISDLESKKANADRYVSEASQRVIKGECKI